MTTVKDTGPSPDPVITIHRPSPLEFQTVARTFERMNGVRALIVHCTDGSERPGTARALAQWCAGRFIYKGELQPPPAYVAHWYVDAVEALQVADESLMTMHAPGANAFSVGIEIVGLANQVRSQWLDEASLGAIKRAASLGHAVCQRWGIPWQQIYAQDLKAGKAGVCGHADVSLAFPHDGAHSDPGPNFPWDVFMSS